MSDKVENQMSARQFWPKFQNKFPADYSPGQYCDIMEFAEAYALASRNRTIELEVEAWRLSAVQWRKMVGLPAEATQRQFNDRLAALASSRAPEERMREQCAGVAEDFGDEYDGEKLAEKIRSIPIQKGQPHE